MKLIPRAENYYALWGYMISVEFSKFDEKVIG